MGLKQQNAIALYSRKSKFTGKGESIGNQVELCKEYVRTHFGEQVATQIVVYEDEGFSGGNLNRPAFQRMMEAAKEGKFQAIIVYRLDRISRNVSDFSGLIEELSRLNIAFISIKEQFDTSTPMGRAMMYIASVFSQLERETIAERIRDNMHELAKTGRWLGGTTPTGYGSEAVKSVTVEGKTKKCCKLKLIPQEGEVVKAIYDTYLETDSLTLTEAALMKRGLRTKNGKYFTRFSIKSILQNPVYMIADQDAYVFFQEKDADLFSQRSQFDGIHGIMAYNRTDQQKGRTTLYLPPEEWIVSVGKHPGLIPGKEWVAIQESLETNKAKGFRKPRGNQALLTGLLYCSCGQKMYPKVGKHKTTEGIPSYTYICQLKERSQRSLCAGKNAQGNRLDLAVIQQIKTLEEDRATFLKQLEAGRKSYVGNRMAWEKQLEELRKEKQELERKLESLVDSLADVTHQASKECVSQRIEKLSSQCKELEQHIQELQEAASQNSLHPGEWERMAQTLTQFREGLDGVSLAQKRRVVRSLVKKVVWDGRCAHVVLFGGEDLWASEDSDKSLLCEDSK